MSLIVWKWSRYDIGTLGFGQPMYHHKQKDLSIFRAFERPGKTAKHVQNEYKTPSYYKKSFRRCYSRSISTWSSGLSESQCYLFKLYVPWRRLLCPLLLPTCLELMSMYHLSNDSCSAMHWGSTCGLPNFSAGYTTTLRTTSGAASHRAGDYRHYHTKNIQTHLIVRSWFSDV